MSLGPRSAEPNRVFSAGQDVAPIAAVLAGLVLLGTTINLHPRLAVDPTEREYERARVMKKREQIEFVLNAGGILLIGVGIGRGLWLRRSKGGAS